MPGHHFSERGFSLARYGILCFVVMLLFAASLSAADVRGRITSLTLNPQNAATGSILVEGKKEKDTSVDKASVRIVPQTGIYRLKDGKKSVARFSDLKVGQTVEVTFTGPVAESYPVQAAAGEILILEVR